jgi:hypothetical protein
MNDGAGVVLAAIVGAMMWGVIVLFAVLIYRAVV